MRTATPETVRALRSAVSGRTNGEPLVYSRWARKNGLHPATVHAALHGRPMSARRENTVRAVLDLPPTFCEMVAIIPGRQYVATRTAPRDRKRRAISLSPDEAAALDALIKERGYRSFNEFWHAELAQEYCSSRLEQGYKRFKRETAITLRIE